MELKQYEPALKYGVVIGSNEVQGAGFTSLANFGSVSVNTNGSAVNVNLFPTGKTAPIAGTITNANIIASGTTKGTIVLISDNGTLIQMVKSGTDGGSVGTFITPIAFQAGSLLQVSSLGSDNANFEAVFYTFA